MRNKEGCDDERGKTCHIKIRVDKNNVRVHLRDHLDQRKATNGPLLVTSNGETEAVVLSPTAFDELMDQADFPRVRHCSIEAWKT